MPDSYSRQPVFVGDPDDLEPRIVPVENIENWTESRQLFLNEIIRINKLPLREKQRAAAQLQDRQQELGAANANKPRETVPRL